MFRVRQILGKYRIEGKLAVGGFATVYKAFDTIEGVRVALKIPHGNLLRKDTLSDFRNEVRIAARLDHPNILPLKNAEFIDGHFVVVFSLGESSLGDRLQKRMALPTALDYAEQLLSAVAYAHENRIIHCDVKPDNLILFPDNRLRLTDFGIAKIAMRTIRASGSGTVGYLAPEQAMGRPSFTSDVFSIGLILYRMMTGFLPEWPYDWPPAGYDRLLRRAHPELIELLRKSLEIDPRHRFRDAGQMLAVFRRIKAKSLRFVTGSKDEVTTRRLRRDWKTVRHRQFRRQFGQILEIAYNCARCDGPVSEAMQCCPWCGDDRTIFPDATRFPAQCPRCCRGLKLDWLYCPWCYGPGFDPLSPRVFSDVRYQGRCANAECSRKTLFPFMRYCPWCHRKVRRHWKIADSPDRCQHCSWGVVRAFWNFCPWCSKSLSRR